MSDTHSSLLPLFAGSAWTEKPKYYSDYVRSAVILEVNDPGTPYESVKFTRMLKNPNGSMTYTIFEWQTHYFLQDYEPMEQVVSE